MWPGAIALRYMFSQRVQPACAVVVQVLSNRARHALTLVLRSTHSSQLSVGLLRFCFFLGG